jgi:hypothetical protein
MTLKISHGIDQHADHHRIIGSTEAAWRHVG